MLPIFQDLQQREREGRPIRAGIIGTGFFGGGVVRQLVKVAGMEPAVVAARNPEKAVAALRSAGIAPDRIALCSEPEEASRALSQDLYVATGVIELPTLLPEIDVVMDCTGSMEAGTHLAVAAIENRKHVVAANLEVQATVGPRLKALADAAGVVYSDIDGDQPGMIMNLYDYCRGLGLEPVVAGNCKGFLNLYATPESQTGYANANGIAPWIATAAADGSKINLEMAAVANATGMLPAKLGMNGIQTSLETLVPDLERHGLLQRGPLVEYTFGIPSGVFIVARSDDPHLRDEFRYLKLGDGPHYVFHDSRVVCHFDAPVSAAKAVLYHAATITPGDDVVAEVASYAKRDLKAGQRLDGIGGYDLYGQMLTAAERESQDLLPQGLAEGAVLKRDIARDQPLRWADLEIEAETLPIKLWREQARRYSTV